MLTGGLSAFFICPPDFHPSGRAASTALSSILHSSYNGIIIVSFGVIGIIVLLSLLENFVSIVGRVFRHHGQKDRQFPRLGLQPTRPQLASA